MRLPIRRRLPPPPPRSAIAARAARKVSPPCWLHVCATKVQAVAPFDCEQRLEWWGAHWHIGHIGSSSRWAQVSYIRVVGARRLQKVVHMSAPEVTATRAYRQWAASLPGSCLPQPSQQPSPADRKSMGHEHPSAAVDAAAPREGAGCHLGSPSPMGTTASPMTALRHAEDRPDGVCQNPHREDMTVAVSTVGAGFDAVSRTLVKLNLISSRIFPVPGLASNDGSIGVQPGLCSCCASLARCCRELALA